MRKVYPERTCPQCQKSFRHPDSRQKYCSRECLFKAYRGSGNPKYRGGSISNGYHIVSEDGKRKRIHRIIMEKHLGRPLEKWEHVHHKDGNRLNNAIENLEVLRHDIHSQQKKHKLPVASNATVPNKQYPTRICEYCGNEFITPKATQRFCGILCGNAARRTGHINSQGYRIIHVKGRYVHEHRYVMEQHIGRRLLSTETVHHRDGNKLNNTIANLELFDSHAEHLKAERFKGYRDETHKQCRLCEQIKPRSDFSPNARCQHSPHQDPHQSRCKQCVAAIQKEKRHGCK